MNRPRQLPRHQAGIALITVLLIVALAATLAVGMLRSQQMAMQYGAGLFSQDQAWLYTQGAEDFLIELLQEDSRRDEQNNRKVDYLGEVWARPFPSFPVDGGVINARLLDLQGRFNLNRLWINGQADADAADVLGRLLKSLDLPESLIPAIVDWIDTDNEPTGADGAEDDFYSRLPRPYRVANRPLSDVSELRLIKGVTPQILARLRPYVCTLPATAKLNINTIDPVIMAALSPTFSQRTAEEFVKQRPAKGYASVDEFLAEPILNGLEATQKSSLAALLTVSSQFFEMQADAEIAGRHSTVLAVLARGESGTLQVIARDLGQKFVTASSGSHQEAEEEPSDDDKTEEKLKEAAKDFL